MGEYRSSGLFIQEPRERIGEISHERLGLSKELSDRIYRWIDVYDSWLNWDDPGDSPPTPIEEVRKFNSEGEVIANLVQKELGKQYNVFFQPEK